MNPNKPGLLIILSRFPYPLEKGDKLRAYYQIQELSQSFSITLVAITNRTISNFEFEQVKQYCDSIVIGKTNVATRLFYSLLALLNGKPIQTGYFFLPSIKRKIKQKLKDKSVKHIYCQLIRTTEYVKNIHEIPKTLDYMDALSKGVERQIKTRGIATKWLFKYEAKRLQVYERQIFDYFENKTIISEQDRNLISHPLKNKIAIIPNGIDRSFFEPNERNEQYDFVFVGNMSYPPNVEAVHYIAKKILPAFPDATFLISGATPDSSVNRLAVANHQIDLTGWVDDIRTSYRKGKIFLAPMMIGTGMQNKILEAMATKTPCVTTPLANNAIQAKVGEEIWVGKNAEELIKHCQLLLDSDALRSETANNAFHFVQKMYTWQNATQKLIQLIQHPSSI